MKDGRRESGEREIEGGGKERGGGGGGRGKTIIKRKEIEKQSSRGKKFTTYNTSQSRVFQCSQIPLLVNKNTL